MLLAMLRREIPQPTDQHHPTRQRGREASIEMETWEGKRKMLIANLRRKDMNHCSQDPSGMLLKYYGVYRNIDTKADKAVIRVRLERPPGWRKGHDLDSFHLALQKEQGL